MYINSSSSVSNFYSLPTTNISKDKGEVNRSDTVDSVNISNEAKNEMKWEEIGQKYDITNISENERLDLADDLFKNKLISEEQHLMMSFSLKNINELKIDGVTVNPNKKYDHLAATEYLLDTSVNGGATKDGINFVKETLDIFAKLSSYKQESI
jgi:hypothetical protein